MDVGAILNASFLGIVQGLTEFIPVSSSGHLEILPVLFGAEKPSTTLILFAHLGTLLALLVYFRRDLWQYAKVGWLVVRRHYPSATKQQKHDALLLRNVVLGTIPAGLMGIAVGKYVEIFYDGDAFSQLAQLATLVAMAALGIVFINSDRWFHGKKRRISELGWQRSLLVGASQAAAFLRGVSRSGITVLTGQMAGLTRTDAAKFSFLMSIPLIAATSALAIYDLWQAPPENFSAVVAQAGATTIAAAVSGYIAIGYLLQYLQHNGLAVFGWYRIAFALTAAALLFL